MTEHFDVVVVGAGISGIGAGCHLRDKCPDRTFVILEGRADIGGTWDLFRYPGIRSDSDMYTLGFSFKPWTEAKAIADGPSILNYLRETATEHGIFPHIRFGHHVERAAWDSTSARWTVEATHAGVRRPLHLQLPLHVQRLLQLRRGLHARLHGHRGLRRRARPSAALASRSRLRRQASGGHRQRRDGRHPGARDGQDGGARDHVAALADLRRLAAVGGRLRQLAAALAAADVGLRHHPLAQRPPPVVVLQLRPQAAAAGEEEAARAGARAPRARLRHPDPLHAALQPVGPAAVPGPRRRPLRRHQGRPGERRHRPDRPLHRDAACCCNPASGSTPTSSSPRPGSTCSSSATSRPPSTGARSSSRRPLATRA